jgi:hypothetical protein
MLINNSDPSYYNSEAFPLISIPESRSWYFTILDVKQRGNRPYNHPSKSSSKSPQCETWPTLESSRLQRTVSTMNSHIWPVMPVSPQPEPSIFSAEKAHEYSFTLDRWELAFGRESVPGRSAGWLRSQISGHLSGDCWVWFRIINRDAVHE